MSELALRYTSSLSRQEAEAKLLAYAMYGEHSYRPRPATSQAARDLVARLGMDWGRTVEACRDFRQAVPYFENMLRSTWTAVGGATTAVIDNRTGAELATLTGPGQISTNEYLAHFEAAVSARDRAVEHSSYAECETAILRGFSSIEGFLAQAAYYWNRQHLEQQLLDTPKKRVSFLRRLDEWVPVLANGRTVNKAGQHWADMLHLKNERDRIAHPRSLARGQSYDHMAQLLNAFRQGIAAMLGHLHLLMAAPVPAVILNAIHMPDVLVAPRGSG